MHTILLLPDPWKWMTASSFAVSIWWAGGMSDFGKWWEQNFFPIIYMSSLYLFWYFFHLSLLISSVTLVQQQLLKTCKSTVCLLYLFGFLYWWGRQETGVDSLCCWQIRLVSMRNPLWSFQTAELSAPRPPPPRMYGWGIGIIVWSADGQKPDCFLSIVLWLASAPEPPTSLEIFPFLHSYRIILKNSPRIEGFCCKSGGV